MKMSINRHLPMPDTNAWPAFTLAWDDHQPGPTDVSYLLDRPAGATGFIKIVDGHLATGDGRRWRMWGQHLVRSQALPPMDLAPVIAGRLAKFGINCMRLHAIDFHWPDGILMRHTESSRSLDPEGLARLDWMVKCLKDQGIYVDMNLHVARRFSAADGIITGESAGWGKPVLYFDDWMITLQKEYARQLLHHLNPFTGHRYNEEPAVALIEITNENSLSEHWQAGWLRGTLAGRKDNWGDIHKVYADELDRRWNAWLARKYERREALGEAWAGDLREYEDPKQGSVRRLSPAEFTSASAGRFQDEAAFYSGIEQSFFREMCAFLRGELGAQQLILGSADHNAGWNGLPMVMANAALDVTDSHFYWQHPIAGKTFVNTPMVDQPDHCAIAHLSRGAVEGYPHLCSEVNEPFPNDSAAEYIPILAAYARLQDWDGVVFYDYHPWPGSYWQEQPWSETYQHYWFDIGDNPVKMAQTALGALMFLRGDAQTARQTIERRLPRAWALEGVRQRGSDDLRPYWIPHLPGRLALVHRTRIVDLAAAQLAPAEGEVMLPADRIASDTGELVWEVAAGDGRVLIDTPRQQAIIGRAGARATRHLAVALQTPFAAVQLASLDEHPIALARRLLLVTGARIANTDQTWGDDARQEPADWGHAPTRIEPVVATLTLRGLAEARRVTAQPLDGHGQPYGESVTLPQTSEGFVLRLGDLPASPWYLVQVERGVD
ncbi:MAG: hypothetical protein M1546_14820 [Chloroflexi bacterium]|nr:hypothetical protein [Chloroflexota bacterium]